MLISFSLLHYLNSEIETWLPSSSQRIRDWTIRTYDIEKLRIKAEVQSALSKVHFTVDLWTSPNSLAIIGIIAHYITEAGELEQSVLALQKLDGEHSGWYLYRNLYSNQLIEYLGQNQAESIMKIINEYGIASKVGYFMMDNAKTNDKMMEALSTCIYNLFS